MKEDFSMKKSIKLIIAIICESIFLAAGAVIFKFLSEPYTLIETLNRIYYGFLTMITLDIFSIVFFVLTVIRIRKSDSQTEADKRLIKRIKGTQKFFVAFCIIFVFSVISTVGVLNITGFTTLSVDRVKDGIIPDKLFGENAVKETEYDSVFLFGNMGAVCFETNYTFSDSDEKMLRVFGVYADKCNPRILKSFYIQSSKNKILGLDLIKTKGKTDNAEYIIKYNNDKGYYYVYILSGNKYFELSIHDFSGLLKDENEVLEYCLDFIK